MCLPIATVALAVTSAAAAFSAYSSIQEGNYQAKVAKNNAITQQRMATAASEKGKRDEQRYRLQVAAAKADQRAAFGASGRELSGSASDILADTSMMGELDALTLRYNSELDAYGYTSAANNSLAQAPAYKQSGRNQAAGTILTTAGSVSGGWKPSTAAKSTALEPITVNAKRIGVV